MLTQTPVKPLRKRRALGEKSNMLIPDAVRESVVFLCVDAKRKNGDADKRILIGTASLILIQDGDILFGYAVTALHVIMGGRTHGNIYVRLNRKDGGYNDFPTTPDDWFTHDQTDVAAIRIPGFPEHTYRYIRMGIIATDDMISQNRFGVGIGEEVFFIGLFSQHPGARRSQPIARVGNISLMPDEPIMLKIGNSAPKPLDAYLVEARSFGGQSGSPVFVYRSQGFYLGDDGATFPFLLLGLVHGHFSKDEEVKLSGSISTEGEGIVPMNLGMAIVIPAQKIVDLLMREDVVADREKIVKKVKEEDYSIVADSAIEEGDEEPGITRKDFEDALKKASGPLKKKTKRSPKKKGNV